MFEIKDYIEFDGKGRAACPSCTLQGKSKKNLSLVTDPSGHYTGAYKCHRGCTPEEIRDAIGVPKAQTVPTALAKSAPKPTTVSPAKVKEQHELLLTSNGPAKQWLNERGISEEMIAHYRLGVARCRVGRSQKWAIAIPIPNPDATAYYIKKRVCPWDSEAQELSEYQPWKQYGIPQMVYLTHSPKGATKTWLCEGEWDALMLGWMMRKQSEIAVACFTCGAGNVPPKPELDRLPGEVTIFYDRNDKPLPNGDRPGEAGSARAAQKIGDRARVATCPAPESEKDNPWDVSDAINAGMGIKPFMDAAKSAKRPSKANKLMRRLKWNDELIEAAPDYTEFLVPDLLTEDELFLLAAGPRTGKSLFAMTLARAVASGDEFLGRPCTQGTVLYVKCEDGDAKIKEREQAQGWSKGLPVAWLDAFKLTEVDLLDELCEELDPRLIVLDTLSRIKDAQVSESSAEMSQLLEPLQNLAQRRGCCILLVHHTGKTGLDQSAAVDIFDMIRGSSAIRAVCRGAMVLAAGERSYRLVVEHGWGKHDLNVLLDANTLTWKLVGEWKPQVNTSQKDLILLALTKLGSASVEQIHTETQIPKKSLYEQLSRLQASEIAEERIVKEGSRRRYTYRLAYSQHIQQLNSVLNSENPDSESDTGHYSTKNNFPTPPSRVDPFSDERMDQHNDTPPQTQTCGIAAQGVDTASDTPIQHPIQQPQSCGIGIGDVVEVRVGRFAGSLCNVVERKGDKLGVRDIKAWGVTRFYAPKNLKRLGIAVAVGDYVRQGNLEASVIRVTPLYAYVQAGDGTEEGWKRDSIEVVRSVAHATS